MAHIIYPFQARSRTSSSFYKFLSSLLIASFLLPASVLAQATDQPVSSNAGDSGATTTAQPEAISPPATAPQSGTLLDQLIDLMTGEEGDTAKPGDSGDGNGSLGLLSGETVYDYGREPAGSRLSPDPSLDLSGAFRYSYPLTVPPGRKGLEPKLSLEYSNQSTENQSIFGYGWSDNIPYIQRINKAGSEQLYSRYDFVSSLDGELLPTAAGTTTSFSAKTENSDFRTYAFTNNQWTVTDKQGTTYKFGTSTGSRQNDTASTTRIYKWMLDEIRDTNGNYIKYEYYKDAGQIYPSKIIYTGNGSTDGIFEVSFSRESRTDNATTSQPAFNVKTNYRINEIQAKVNSTWVRKYALSYTTGDNGARSLLSSITETGQGEDATTISLPATSFTYQPSQHSIATSTAWTIPEYTAFADRDSGTRFVDVNGDGLADITRLYYSGGTGAIQNVYLNKGDGTGWTASTTWSIPADVGYFAGNADYGVRFAEVNGDGLIDLIRSQYPSTTVVPGF
jgi:hypothetical protein